MILEAIVKFVIMQILQALITAQMVKDSVLFILKELAVHTKTKWDDKVYKRVKFYFTKDTSEHLKLPSDQQKEE
jgi:hypothetical protein